MNDLIYQDKIVGEIRLSHHGDCLTIGHNLREQEALELWGYDNSLPVEGVTNSFNKSVVSMTIEHDGIAIAMFGIMILNNVPTLWLMPTDKLNSIGRIFVKNTREWIKKMLIDYSTLTAYIDCRNTESERWMRFVGGKYLDTWFMGKDSMPFKRFIFMRDICKI